MQVRQKIAVFGGTFDPVHKGHVAVLKAAAKALKPVKIIIVPAYKNPLKTLMPGASANQRVTMCRKAFSEILNVSVCLFEIRKKKPVYTIETIRYLRKRFGANKEYVFICGSDTAKNLSQWRDIDKLCKICSFAAAGRRGAAIKKSARVSYRIPMKQVHVEASSIRSRIQAKSLNENNLPPAILQWVRQNNLYGYAKN
ncbi:MAG: nicotinate (nicotinamide) nucleotide adenylyltransferase [Candidatus Omnitrophica bacterium]|nr:nicotinate (nicotinamide) nucleotide adenylyltransferase [Candidatus Omnitrophota bacterium]